MHPDSVSLHQSEADANEIEDTVVDEMEITASLPSFSNDQYGTNGLDGLDKL